MPIVMGAVMGPMMLWMAHRWIVSGAAATPMLGFAAAHLAILAVLLGGGLLLGRRAPALRRRLHRPSAAHVARMLGAAAVSAGIVHLLHGGPV